MKNILFVVVLTVFVLSACGTPATPVPVPTDTPVPPLTATPVPIPTDTPVPPSTETPIPPTANSACIGSSGNWSTPPNGELSIMFTIQDCKITAVFIMGLINGQWVTVSNEANEPINGSEFNFLHNFSDQDRYNLSGTFSSPTSASIQLVIFKGFRFTTDQPSPLNEDLIINATAIPG